MVSVTPTNQSWPTDSLEWPKFGRQTTSIACTAGATSTRSPSIPAAPVGQPGARVFSLIEGEPRRKQYYTDARTGRRAVTSIWAAVGRVWEGEGGKYLPDKLSGRPAPEERDVADRGWSSGTCPRQEGEDRLWEFSEWFVGVCGER